MKRKELMLYIHIPFCARKCAYCDFLSFSSEEREKKNYIHALVEETKTYQEISDQYTVNSIFFGGGTPSILSELQITLLMSTIREVFFISDDAEITIESNPGTLNKEKLLTYRTIGINRLSIGLQSTEDKELKLLGRIHTYEQFLQNYTAAREAGFTNINIDLMSALPGQTVESYKESLKQIVDLRPEHISAYSLIIEEGTPFYEWYHTEDEERSRGEEACRTERAAKGKAVLPTEDDERTMYHLTKQMLRDAGYERYEISNYAKPGYACRHNSGYWKRKEYLGIGLGASSLFQGRRYQNVDDIKLYISEKKTYGSLIGETEKLSKKAEMEEFMFLGLRLTDGILMSEFEKQFQTGIRKVYGTVIDKFVEEGLLAVHGDKLALTEHGLDVSNQIFSAFLL